MRDLFVDLDNTVALHRATLRKLLESPQLVFNQNLHSKLPLKGGVYRVFEKEARLSNSLYFGTTNNLQRRIYSNHLAGKRRRSTLRNKLITTGRCKNEQAVTEFLVNKCLVQVLFIEEELERTSFEHFAISILQPTHND